jgi:hypothetical protein
MKATFNSLFWRQRKQRQTLTRKATSGHKFEPGIPEYAAGLFTNLNPITKMMVTIIIALITTVGWWR